jgi:hypothetical protein
MLIKQLFALIAKDTQPQNDLIAGAGGLNSRAGSAEQTLYDCTYRQGHAVTIQQQIDVDCRRRRIKFTGRVTGAEIALIECLLDPLAFALRRPLRLLLAKFVSDSRPR